MSEQVYTPGPWTIHRGNEIWAKHGPVAMTVARAEDDGSEEEANARLISAAPEMLAACRKVLVWVTMPSTYNAKFKAMLEEAIEKGKP